MLWGCWGGCHGDAEVVAMGMSMQLLWGCWDVTMVMLGWLLWRWSGCHGDVNAVAMGVLGWLLW